MGGLKLLSSLLRAEEKLKHQFLEEETNVWLEDQIIAVQFTLIRSLILAVLRFTYLKTFNLSYEEVGGQLICYLAFHN